MGVFDSLKNRFGKDRRDDRSDYDDDYYDDGEYQYDSAADGYDRPDGDSYDDGYAEEYDDGFAQTSNTAFRDLPTSSYRPDAHTPFVTLSDVRSQELLPYSSSTRTDVASRRTAASDVSPAGSRAGSLATAQYSSPYLDDSPQSMAHTLSRTGPNKLAQLHQERQRLNGAAGAPAANAPTPSKSQDRLSATMAADAAGQDAAGDLGHSPSGDFPAYYASRSGSPQPRSARPAQAASRGFRQVVALRPSAYADAEQVAKALKEGSAVAVDLTSTRPELAKRILDFSFGAAAVLSAQVDSPANRIYVITKDYALTDDEREVLRARGLAL
ncbi:MAG: cell division protein SepF [Coriobacteriales bacterium]|jgi:cell division inhibitor SepF|nr:cell division protein SepF [Coriobacteriales bacterium]